MGVDRFSHIVERARAFEEAEDTVLYAIYARKYAEEIA